jgi:hypothetical protein
MRSSLRLALAAAVAASGLAACSRTDAPSPSETPEPTPEAAQAADTAEEVSAGADRLAFVDQTGTPRLLLDCLAGPRPQMRAAVASFRKIASEDRLTVGAGDEAFAMAADLSAPDEGVVASNAIDLDLLRRISDGQPVSAVYGAQTVGPLRPPPGVLPDSFVVRCRNLVQD